MDHDRAQRQLANTLLKYALFNNGQRGLGDAAFYMAHTENMHRAYVLQHCIAEAVARRRA